MRKIKFIAMAVAALMLLSACSVVSDVTCMAKVGDTQILKSEFNYYLSAAKNTVAQAAQQSGVSLTNEKEWQENKVDGVIAAQKVKDEAQKNIREVLVWEAMAQKAGFKMTAEIKNEVATQKANLIESVGGRYQYEEFFAGVGVNISDLDSILTRAIYASKYQEQYRKDHESDFTINDEQAKKALDSDFITVKHILIKNTPAEGTEAKDGVDYDAQAKKKAEGILKDIKAGKDFDELMEANSEDGRDDNGNIANPTYTFAKDGSMDAAFEEAAFKLKEGDVSELVKSSYGYHIIMRVANPSEGTDYENALQQAKAKAESEGGDKLTEKFAKELGFWINTKVISKTKIK